MKEKELLALISLLDDTNEEIYQTVKQNLVSKGIELIPFLEKQWELNNNEIVQERIEKIISQIQFNDVRKEFEYWVKNDSNNIAKGAFLIAKHYYPNLDYSDINDKIQQIYNNVWLEINDNLTALEKIRIINKILFGQHKFRGKQNYFKDPKSSYINIVFAVKRGSPILLSIIYLAIAQKLSIPVKGVNLHNNFILAYNDEIAAKIAYPDKDYGVLFYINPFNRGSVFNYKEIDTYLEKQNLKKHSVNYTPINNLETIQILILELIKIYNTTKPNSKIIEQLRILYKISTNTINQ